MTALSAAAAAREVERVRALLAAGCTAARASGPRSWNALHHTLASVGHSRHDPHRRSWWMMHDGAESDSVALVTEWAEARAVTEALLAAADSAASDGAAAAALLLSPKAEHTPLMLACERGADEPTIQLLASRTAACAARALARTDSQLNTALHLAVKGALESKAALAPPLTLLVGLIEHGRAAAVAIAARSPPLLPPLPPPLPTPLLTPSSENARGVTPIELAREALVDVWPTGEEQHARKQLAHQRARRRQARGLSGELPPARPPAVSTQASRAWQAYMALHGAAAADAALRNRVTVGLDAVREAGRKAAAAASAAAIGGAALRRRYDAGEDKDKQLQPPTVHNVRAFDPRLAMPAIADV